MLKWLCLDAFPECFGSQNRIRTISSCMRQENIDIGNLFGWNNFLDFGICNFADFFIVGGAIALLFAFFFFDKDAFFPVGKYKALAKEGEEKEGK